MTDTDGDLPLGWFDPRGAATMRAAWEDSPALVTVVVGPDHQIAYQNAASRELFGERPLGTPLLVAFPDGSGDPSMLDEVRTTGRVVTVRRELIPVRDRSGAALVLSYVITPLPGAMPADGLVIRATDVTSEVRAEQAAARASLLADISSALTSALDPTAALQAFVNTLVPSLGDFAAFYVVDETPDQGGPPVPPLVTASAPEIAGAGPPPPPTARDEPSPWDEPVRSGAPLIIPINVETFDAVAPDEDAARWLAATAGHSIAVLPIVAAGQLTGALLLMAAGKRPAYADEDLPFFTDVAARTGAALAQQFSQQRQRRIAAQLQRALLPPDPPAVPDLQLAARYLAGAPGVDVGGDWWHVQDLGKGRVALAIGDVAGRGVAAAAVMGQARAAMGAAGYANLSPAQVLALLDEQLADLAGSETLAIEAPPPRFATACYGVVDTAGDVLRVANAGHTPILRRSADGDIDVLQLPTGPPLGLRSPRYDEAEIRFAPGDLLAFVTDGLVESRDLDIDDGLAALGDALLRFGSEPDLGTVLQHVLDAMTALPGHGDDDVALLLARRR